MSPSKINCVAALGPLLLSARIANAIPTSLTKNKFPEHTVLADAGGPEYTYRRTTAGTEPYGPSEWHLGYPECGGAEQSPINLSLATGEVARPEEFDLHFTPTLCQSTDLIYEVDGDSYKVDYSGCAAPPFLSFEGQTYTFLQLHIHSASEHSIGSTHHDAEVHLVHVRDGTDSSLLVVGILIDSSMYGDNEEIDKLWSVLNVNERDTTEKEFPSDVYAMLPATPSYVHYMGSLTTPPCTEGVKWIVMTDPILMSDLQLQQYRHHSATIPDSKVDEQGNTNRPNQPLNHRTAMIVF